MDKVRRFFKDKWYIGVNNKSRDTFGEWRDEINFKKFQGRPHGPTGVYEYDEIYDYTPDRWAHLLAKAETQAQASNGSREVAIGPDYVYLVPVWIHHKKIEESPAPRPKDIFHPTQAEEYALALHQGNKRFGSECKHEHVRDGRCTKCLRRVVTRPRLTR